MRGTDEETLVTIPSAVYDNSLLVQAIQQALRVNGDYEVDEEGEHFPFNVSFNTATAHSFIEFGDDEYKMNLAPETDGITSTFARTIGFMTTRSSLVRRSTTVHTMQIFRARLDVG